MTAPIVLHLLAADGATFDLPVQLPPIRSGRAVVRISAVRAVSVGSVKILTNGTWVLQP